MKSFAVSLSTVLCGKKFLPGDKKFCTWIGECLQIFIDSELITW